MGILNDMTRATSTVEHETSLEGMKQALRANDSVVQEIFKTTSENTECLKELTENCVCNREKIDGIIKHLEAETARVSKRYDETLDVVDMFFEEMSDNWATNDVRLEDIDREIVEARKMQMRTHITCGIAMISSIASIILTIILA